MTRALRRSGRWLGLLLVLLAGMAGMAMRPAVAQEAPQVCRIGVNLEDLHDLDMAGDTFGAILWIWSLCPSDELAVIEALTFPTAAPGLSRDPPEVVALPSGGRYTAQRVQGTFRYNWDMTHYPFDRQRVVIPLDESRYGAARVLFEADVEQSFMTPDIGARLDEWRVTELALEVSVSEEASTYGLPDSDGARYARLEIALVLERAHLLTFVKLTAGVFAGVFIALMSFFYDPNDRSGFGGKIGLQVGVLFAVLLNMRAADAHLGDSGHPTLVTKIHLVTLGLLMVLAVVALRDRLRVDRGEQVPHPDWRGLAVIGTGYVTIVAAMIAASALS